MLGSILVRGFKSIEDQELTLGSINVLIGANGAGKSNLVSFFRLLGALANQDLQLYVARTGGASSLLYQGPKVTPRIVAGLTLVTVDHTDLYEFKLAFGEGDRLFFENENAAVEEGRLFLEGETVWSLGISADHLGGGHIESHLREASRLDQASARVLRWLTGLGVHHLDDTSTNSPIRAQGDAGAMRPLRAGGENLAAFLYRLREVHRPYYERIVATVRIVVPFFRDFVLEPSVFNANRIQLRWRAVDSEYDFGAHQLSDGTLRFMALASLFLQPEQERPQFIVVDEPELGLHPMALQVLAGLVRSAAATSCQVLLSTQSTTLLDQFEPEEVIIAELEHNRTVFKRPTRDQLGEWLEEYTLSELWEKNILGGRP